ncbi:hypothetical protein C0J52_25593, partial [Blattella germanica]
SIINANSRKDNPLISGIKRRLKRSQTHLDQTAVMKISGVGFSVSEIHSAETPVSSGRAGTQPYFLVPSLLYFHHQFRLLPPVPMTVHN